MILENSIKVKNHKCFSEEAEGFEKICSINIIIGKNNSGKSTLIDLIDYTIEPNENFINTGRNRSNSEVLISSLITERDISIFPEGHSGGGIPGLNHYEYGKTLLDSKFIYSLSPSLIKKVIFWEKPILDTNSNYMEKFEHNIQRPFNGKIFIRISAERDIKPQGADSTKIAITADGEGSTNVIRRIINELKNGNELNDPDLIQKILLKKLNEITNPDIEFSDIVARDNGEGFWEIYFRNDNSGLIALSKMGSGIKTILIVLLNLIVIPEIKHIRKENLVFGLEELENNLHPLLQRRLFNYISEYSDQYKSYFFITTHSNVVIDLFGTNKNAQILHIENNGISSFVKVVETHIDSKNVLRDLDYKASDLLLSNGIIWVEGASDAIYLELFIYLYKEAIGQSLSRLNYTIQSLSTAIWKYAGFADFDWIKIDADIQNKIISLYKLNHNHLIIIDKDDNYDDIKPSGWKSFSNGTGKNKARLIHESLVFGRNDERELVNNYGDTNDNKLFFWITEGTFESYLKNFIKNKGKEKFEKYFDIKETRGYFEKKRNGEDHSKSKIELAAEIGNFCIQSNFTIDDFAPIGSSLRNKIERLFETIKSWN